MKLVLLVVLFLFNASAHAQDLLCLVTGSIYSENYGKKIEHEITKNKEFKNPEYIIYFNLDKKQITQFWRDEKGVKTRSTYKLKMASRILYYDEFNSTYLFNSNYRDGVLTGRVSNSYHHEHYRCQRISLEKAEKDAGIPFSQFK